MRTSFILLGLMFGSGCRCGETTPSATVEPSPKATASHETTKTKATIEEVEPDLLEEPLTADEEEIEVDDTGA